MSHHVIRERSPDDAPRTCRTAPRSRRRRWTSALTGLAVVLAAFAATATMREASAADTNPYQRGPAPTAASIAADRGPFATAQTTVAKGNGFGGGVIYYPTDTSQGTFGAIAIAPGYDTAWSWYAWQGPRLASFGFVVIGIETNTLTDWADARATQLLAALDWLVASSPVRDRIDRDRLAVGGHSMGGGGALTASVQRPSLLTAVGMAGFMPSGTLATTKVPTILFAGQSDGTVTPAATQSLYNTIPAGVEHAYVEIAGEGHGFPAGGGAGGSGAFARTMMVWLKVFMDRDTRYSQFLCPALSNMNNISKYQATCPLDPPGGTPTPSSSSSRPSSPSSPSASSASNPPASSSQPPVAGACRAAYATTSSWSGGFQGEVTVTAGSAAISSWTVTWTLASGQSVTQVWNGTLSASGSAVTVKNAAYNGALAAGGSTTFGFLGSGTPSTPSLTCTTP